MVADFVKDTGGRELGAEVEKELADRVEFVGERAARVFVVAGYTVEVTDVAVEDDDVGFLFLAVGDSGSDGCFVVVRDVNVGED